MGLREGIDNEISAIDLAIFGMISGSQEVNDVDTAVLSLAIRIDTVASILLQDNSLDATHSLLRLHDTLLGKAFDREVDRIKEGVDVAVLDDFRNATSIFNHPVMKKVLAGLNPKLDERLTGQSYIVADIAAAFASRPAPVIKGDEPQTPEGA